MPKYIYQSKLTPDQTIQGLIEAESKESASIRLLQQGKFPLLIREKDIQKYSIRFKSESLYLFTHQLYEFLDSGVDILTGLGVIEEHIKDKNLRVVVNAIIESIKEGKSLSDALSLFTAIFSPFYIGMVKAGEIAGALPDVLSQLADFQDKESNFKDKVRIAFVYPFLIGITGIITIVILLGFVIPKLAVIFEETEQLLPFPTKILVALSRHFYLFWILLFILFVCAMFVGQWMKRDYIKLRLPYLGELIRKIEMARFTRILGILIENGTPILVAMEVTAQTLKNSILRQQVLKIAESIKMGSDLSSQMSNSPHFSSHMVSMVAAGEECGSLERSLFKIASSYERDVDRMLKIITLLIEPVMILLCGIIVGFIAFALCLPIMSTNPY